MAGDVRSSALVHMIPHLIPYGFLLLCCSVFVFGGGGISSQGATVPTAASPLSPPPLPSPVMVNATHDATCLDSERGALLQFQAGLVDPHGRLSSWQLGALDCCRWRGVACDSRTGVVVKLDLRNSSLMLDGSWNLSGRIDASLVHLKSLRHLDLSGNTFDGITIPTFIGSFKELRYLNLSYAGFTGAIPPQLGNLTRLKYLDISSYNSIFGSLRAGSLEWVSGLSSLRHLALNQVNLSAVGSDWFRLLNERLPFLVELRLSSCGLRGSVAHSLNFSSLETIDLLDNSISSRMPTSLANVSSLVHVNMGFNSLYGPIPLAFSELPSLEYLVLSGNRNLTADVSQLLGRGRWSRIKRVWVMDNSLSGKIPSALGNLTSLQELNLLGNNIAGGIPASIGNLTSLVWLDLSGNNIAGEIPTSIGNLTSLVRLDLSGNNISGYLCISDGAPPAYLPGLEILYLAHNSLIGDLTACLEKLTSLEFLDVSFNQFTGMVTEAHLSRLRNLYVLGLGYNSLTLNVSSDWIPPFQQLSALDVASCGLGPAFPSWIKALRDLRDLDISMNGISGEIPAWFWDLSSKTITRLNISYNNITGQVPSSWSPSHEAFILDMNSNFLEGHLPPLPHNLSSPLLFLDFSANRFRGPIWPNIGERLPDLVYLSLAGNYLTGEIPATIRRMKNLGVLDLSRNNLTGGVLMLACPSLTLLNLGSNSLTGAIPMSLGRLENLQALLLSGNMLSGKMPSSICGCSALKTLDLGSNILYGNIPVCIGALQALRVLRLRANRFSGEIPSQVSNLRLLQVLDVADNNLTGQIPRALENLTGMMHPQRVHSSLLDLGYNYKLVLTMHWKGQDLEFVIKTDLLITSIDLSKNKLSGEIPTGLMNLAGVVSLNLSRNLITGIIPKRIGGMHELETLDLSNNYLSGEIPTSLTSLNFLESLNLSYNNFSGIIPIGGQMGTFSESSFYGNHYLCGPLFQPNCSRGSIQSVNIDEDVETNTNEWFFFSMGLGFAFGLLVPFVILLVKRSWSTTYFELVDLIVDKFL